MSSLDNHPFDIDQVLRLTGPVLLGGEWSAWTATPTDFDDPFIIVESIGWSGQEHYMEVTASNGETYEISGRDFANLTLTPHRGESGLARAIAEFRK